jgi:photosystem II stability/assembly factor-like uncharacterized protein
MSRRAQPTRSARGRTLARKWPPWVLAAATGLVVLLALTGWYTVGRNQGSDGAGATTSVEMPHLHGLGFSADGRELIVPAHNGLRIFADDTWQVPDVPAHDYMGYAPMDSGFYSSGHPAPGTALANPLGLVKSTDNGKTLATLGFAGESDFHVLAVGYRNHAIYVLNAVPNSALGTGLYYSLDDGKTWEQSAAQGVTSRPIQLAVHPSEANVIALATYGELLLSTDHGATFVPVPPVGQATAAAFSSDGTQLLVGSTTLMAYTMANGQVTSMRAPQLGAEDAISSIAVNPVRPQELAFATFERNIFRSQDSGQTWQQIARAGIGLIP